MSTNQEDKSVRVKFITDMPGVRNFNDAVLSMTNSVKKLNDELKKVTTTLESFNRSQGKTKGVNVGGTHTSKGAGAITESIIGDASGVKNAAKATETALSATGANIKRFVNSAIEDLKRLQMATGNAGVATPALASGGGQGGGGVGGGSGSSSGGRRQPSDPWKREEPQSVWGKEGWGGYMGAQVASTSQAYGVPMGAANYLGRGAKTVFTGLGVGGMALVGLAAAAELGLESHEKLAPRQINYSVDKPFMTLGANAANAGIFQRLFSSSQNRDVAYVTAFNQALQNPELRQSLASTNIKNTSIAMASGMDWYSLKGGVKAFGSWLQAQGQDIMAGDALKQIDVMGLKGPEKLNAQQLVYKAAAFQLSGKNAEQLTSAISNTQTLNNPYFNMMSNELAQNSLGRVQMLRTAGLGAGQDKYGNLNYEKLRSRLLPLGYDVPDYAQGHQALLGIGAGYQRKGVMDPIRFVGDQIAGFHGIGQVLDLGGILGGGVGGARAFYDLAQNSIGKGRLDVAVGSSMFPNLAASLLSQGSFGTGNTAFNYMGLAGGLVGGIENGMATMDVGEQKRRMALLTQGNQAVNKMMLGGGAPIYNAASLLATLGVTGKFDASTVALDRMSTEALTSIARGGEIPAYYSELGGVNQDNAKALLAKRASIIGLESISSIGDVSGLPTLRAYQEKGGDLFALLDEKTSGLTGKARRSKAQQVIQTLAGNLYHTGAYGESAEQVESMLFSALAGSDKWASAFPAGGKGVHAAGPRGPEKEGLRAQGEQEALKARLGETDLSEVENLLSQILSAIKGNVSASGTATQRVKSINAKSKGPQEPEDLAKELNKEAGYTAVPLTEDMVVPASEFSLSKFGSQ